MGDQPNTSTFLKALAISSQSCLSSQRLHAEIIEPEVLRLHPLPLQRPGESIEATAIVCCAGVLPPLASEDLRMPQSSAERTCSDAIFPRYSQHTGDTDNKRHVLQWGMILQWGMFVISVKLWVGFIQFIAGEVKICAEFRVFRLV